VGSQILLQRETARAVVAVLKGGKPRSLANPEALCADRKKKCV